MKHKETLAVLCSAALLTGCSEKTSPSEPLTTEVETAAYTMASLTSSTADEPERSTDIGTEQFYTRVNDGSIDIMERGGSNEPVQTIEGDFQEYNRVWFEDFDFDGCDDMGVNTNDGCLYYRFDSSTGSLSDWQTLSDIREELHISDLYENCLSSVILDAYGSSNIYYKWENGEAVPFRKRSFYVLAGEDIVEFYNMGSDGQWVKATRNAGKGESFHLEELPPYFRINEDTLDVLVGEKVVQTIEGYRLPELADTLNSGTKLECGTITAESLIDEVDYDNDGHFDAYITKSWDKGFIGDYYRYDPEKRQYVLWDELNALGGARLFPDPEEKGVLHSYELPFTDNTYKWISGRLKLVSRDVYEYDDKGESIVHRYVYDENGRETLVEN